MNISTEVLSRKLGELSHKLDTNSPAILFGVGIAAVGIGAVMACRATLKLERKLDETQMKVLVIQHDILVAESVGDEPSPTAKKELVRAYVTGGMSIIRLYAPSVLVGVIGIAALTKSHTTLMDRNANLATAYTLLSETFENYRGRVRTAYGEEAEQRIYAGDMETVFIVTDEGEEVGVEVPIDGPATPYRYRFDETNPNFSAQPQYNNVFLECQRTYANTLLRSRGHVLLNDIYDMLGVPRTSTGAIVGWTFDPEHELGDERISFGIDAAYNEAFQKRWDPTVWLTFNVEGLMFNNISQQ